VGPIASRGLELLADGAQPPIVVHDRSKLSLFASQLSRPFLVARNLGSRPFSFDFLESPLE
jgi:hypothetical protein